MKTKLCCLLLVYCSCLLTPMLLFSSEVQGANVYEENQWEFLERMPHGVKYETLISILNDLGIKFNERQYANLSRLRFDEFYSKGDDLILCLFQSEHDENGVVHVFYRIEFLIDGGVLVQVRTSVSHRPPYILPTEF